MPEDIANPFKNPLSNKIWQRVSQIVNANSEDFGSGLTSPFELASACSDLALFFTVDSYQPKLKKDADFLNIKAFTVYLCLFMLSAQVYLQERAIKTGDRPYLIRQNKEEIVEAAKNAMLKIKEGDLPEVPGEVIDKIFDIFNKKIADTNYEIKGHKLKKKYFKDMKIILSNVGYYFAREMIIEQNVN